MAIVGEYEMKFTLLVELSGSCLFEAEVPNFFAIPKIGDIVEIGGHEKLVKSRFFEYGDDLCDVVMKDLCRVTLELEQEA